MLRSFALSVILIDIGLVVGRVFTLPDVFTMPGFVITIASLALSFAAAIGFVFWFSYSNVLSGRLRVPLAMGAAGGVIMIVHMALENFGSRIGEDSRLTLAVMLAIFALWFSSGWQTSRDHLNLLAGAVAGCLTALVSAVFGVTFGFIGMYFDVPAAAYVATWPEYIQSGSRDPHAFAVANTLDAATSHLVTALLLGSILGSGGWLLATMTRRYSRSVKQQGR